MILLVTGCSGAVPGGQKGGDSPSATVSVATSHPSETGGVSSASPIQPSGGGQGASTTLVPQQPTAGASLNALFPGSDFVWRAQEVDEANSSRQEEPNLAVGAYRIDVVCVGGSVGINVDGRRVADVNCSDGLRRIPVCVARAGLSASNEWIRRPATSFSWQLVHSGTSCPRPT